MCKKEFKDVDILHRFFIYLFTHLTVLGNYKVFHEIQKLQIDYATYIFVICIYIINFIIVKHMFECLLFLEEKTNILKTYLWSKYIRIIYTFLLEDILPWHRFKGFLVPSGPTNLIPVDEIHYNIFSLMLLKLLPEFDSFNVKIDRISKSLSSSYISRLCLYSSLIYFS